jgi:hypothetical protein
MTLGISLEWHPIEWEDPLGGVVKFLPFSPLVDFSESLGTWHGLALLCSSEEPLLWLDQFREEKESPNIVRDAMIAQMGHSGRLVKEMAFMERDDIGCFPDPIPFSAFELAKSTEKPVWFLEPEMNDEDWVELTLECVDQRTSIRNLVRSIGSGRKMMRIAKSIAEKNSPYADVQLHIAASLSAAWWIVESGYMSEDLLGKINQRIASRIRGALHSLSNSINEQVDDEEVRVLLVPVPIVRLQGVLAALNNLPETEITVENQVFRFITSESLDSEIIIQELGAVRSGNMLVKQLRDPPYTILIGVENGEITVHGSTKEVLARMAVSELLLGLGLPDSGLKTEIGPVTSSCSMPSSIDIERAADVLSSVRMEEKLDAIRIADVRHELELLIFRNGRTVITDAISQRIAQRAADYWVKRFQRLRLFN